MSDTCRAIRLIEPRGAGQRGQSGWPLLLSHLLVVGRLGAMRPLLRFLCLNETMQSMVRGGWWMLRGCKCLCVVICFYFDAVIGIPGRLRMVTAVAVMWESVLTCR